jgi:hypothetical protein
VLYLRSEPLDSMHASDELGTGQHRLMRVQYHYSKYLVIVVTNTIQDCGTGVIFC